MIETKQFYDSLVSRGLDFFTGVPDSLLKNFCACVTENSPRELNIIAANEGNAAAMALGYHLSTGKYGVVYMQNSGEGNIVNPLMSLADEDVYSVPMLLIIGWRGEPGVKDEPQHVKQGKVTIPLLDAMGVKNMILDDNWSEQLDECIGYMKQTNRPCALIVRKGAFSSYSMKKAQSDLPLTREDALGVILGALKDDDFVVSTTGKTSREVFELREARGQGHANDFLTVGGMGHTASIALGAALGTEKNVWCIDGDGSFLMHMGGFAVIAQNAPKNFKYIINNNGAHESVGGQPTVGMDIDIPGVLRAVGFRTVIEASTGEQIAEGMKVLRDSELAALVISTRQGSRDDLGRPTTTPCQNKQDMMKKFAEV
ncbi:MAG: phosphonopyruvate decarboxylase [Ruminococcaceae bacterium]|nr:phosphonopyruvate decarboxylase [Oscillospiraceae bacterium]